ncbi:peptidase M61 [Tenacibaculum sp. KUL152]|nr:peptidase M61 [Tenacibaculum sp. KUL152]
MASPTLHYALSLSNWRANEFSVTLSIPEHDHKLITLSLPSWIPGSYMVRDFAKSVVTINATNADTALTIDKQDKQTWLVHTQGKPCQISYVIHANDLSIRSAFINDEYAFINGTSAFLNVDELPNAPCTLEVIVPKCDNHLANWKAYTSMPVNGATSSDNVATTWYFCAENYLEFIDHPIYVGEADTYTFTVDGVDFTLLFSGHNNIDYARIACDLTPICRHHLNLFGEPHPIKDYLFMTLLADNGFGGLEHKYSTALLYPRFDLPLIGESETKTDGYITFLSLCSHEFFHTWHVKRIKPEVMVTPDLSRETYTNQLWIYEGFTSFYDDVTLARTGVISDQKYLDIVAQNVSRLLQNEGRHKQSAAESSFDAWTKFYKQDASAPNNIVSYYTKGGIIALGLDLLLRSESNGTYNIDSLMKLLWEHYGKGEIGTPDDVIQKLCKTHFGIDVSHYLDAVVYGTQDVALHEIVTQMGVEYKTRARVSGDDKGGLTTQKPIHHQLGATLKAEQLGLSVMQVFEGLAAQQAGILVNDIIIAVNQHVVNAQKLQRILDTTKDDCVNVTVIRDGRLLTLDLPILPARQEMAYFEIVDNEKLAYWLAVN